MSSEQAGEGLRVGERRGTTWSCRLKWPRGVDVSGEIGERRGRIG